MSWKVMVRPDAIAEIEEAGNWYAAQRPELKSEFLEDVELALQKLGKNPRLRSRKPKGRDVRWFRTGRFPYRVIYELQESERSIIVAAVIHTSRADHSWLHRFGRED